MEFRTIVRIEKPTFEIQPMERMLFVGSCFADNIGKKFVEEKFRATVNPYGVMYNPASILHTVEKVISQEKDKADETGVAMFRIALFTLGTNHVYRLKETGEIVDNCQKRPARLFQEEELSIDLCADYLERAMTLLKAYNPDIKIVLTVSPIRYAKYGYHTSQLSKATLLLAAEKCINDASRLFPTPSIYYFPAYEIVNDELRDYRFYREDMLHPSDQAVEYIWQRLQETMLSKEAKQWLREWKPIKEALNHRPFNPDSPEHKAFVEKTMQRIAELKARYPELLAQPTNPVGGISTRPI